MWCCSKNKSALSVFGATKHTYTHISFMLIQWILRHSIFHFGHFISFVFCFFIIFARVNFHSRIISPLLAIHVENTRKRNGNRSKRERANEFFFIGSATLVVHTIRVYSFGIFSIRDHIVHLNWLTWHFDLTDIQCKSTKEIAINRTPTIAQSNKLIIWLNLKVKKILIRRVFFFSFRRLID